MPSASSNMLATILCTEIDTHGPIPVSRWMELALYHPELGYYRQAHRDPFGTQGDFFTAEQLTPFGDMLAVVVGRLADLPHSAFGFGVLELGAGRRDLRAALAPWHYVGHDWDTTALPATHRGLILANEFFDAMPVRVLRRGTDGWIELAVAHGQGQFCFTDAPWSLPPQCHSYAAAYGSTVPIGGVLEVNESLATWMKRIGDLLRAGRLLVFDYGYVTEELPRLPEGTLMSYRHQVALDDILTAPGDQDITAHVNLSALISLAELNGLRLEASLTLREWALQVWNEEALESRWRQADAKWRMQWKQLVFGMGDTFRVLQFRKES